MCGILFHYSKVGVDEKIFFQSLKLQQHRGPDFIKINKFSNNMIFGHCRLSIIDLSKNSNQPMINNKNKNVIIYNGEIYNYLELKKNLLEKK